MDWRGETKGERGEVDGVTEEDLSSWASPRRFGSFG